MSTYRWIMRQCEIILAMGFVTVPGVFLMQMIDPNLSYIDGMMMSILLYFLSQKVEEELNDYE